MELLPQAAQRRSSGAVLPTVFSSLHDAGVEFHRGSLFLTAGSPGTGKSTFALNHALRVKVPTLYLCMDTPRRLTVIRAAQSLCKLRAYEVESQIEDPDSMVWRGLRSVPHLASFFRGSASVDQVAMMIGAYAEIRGEMPQLIIIDNLVNMAREYAEQVEIMRDLDAFSKDVDCCIHVLTHVKGAYKDGVTPIPLSGIVNQISEYPHSIVTLTRNLDDDRVLYVAPVKNRTGTSDSSGTTRLPLQSDFSTMRVV